MPRRFTPASRLSSTHWRKHTQSAQHRYASTATHGSKARLVGTLGAAAAAEAVSSVQGEEVTPKRCRDGCRRVTSATTDEVLGILVYQD